MKTGLVSAQPHARPGLVEFAKRRQGRRAFKTHHPAGGPAGCRPILPGGMIASMTGGCRGRAVPVAEQKGVSGQGNKPAGRSSDFRAGISRVGNPRHPARPAPPQRGPACPPAVAGRSGRDATLKPAAQMASACWQSRSGQVAEQSPLTKDPLSCFPGLGFATIGILGGGQASARIACRSPPSRSASKTHIYCARPREWKPGLRGPPAGQNRRP